jgi:hypothetical protein
VGYARRKRLRPVVLGSMSPGGVRAEGLTMLSSPKVESGLWEVWVFASPDYRECVRACGLFREEDAAVHAASLLSDYLHLGAWNENLLDNASEAGAAADLRVLPEEIRLAGIDPARTHVTARRYDTAAHDNAESEVPHGWRNDRGAAQGPHLVRVLAERR